MLRLETVEDFEKVDYGYCDYCKSISTYNHSTVKGEINLCFTESDYIHCLGCGNDFFPESVGSGYSFRQVGTMLEFWFTPRDLLESRIKELKKEQRSLAGKIRGLAKLRPVKKSGSTL